METIASKSIEQMVEDNQRLVYHIIQQKFPTFLFDEDIVQCGMIGLWKACKAFNPEKSKLSTFASRCIINEIRMEFRRRKNWSSDNIVSIETEISGVDGLTLGDCLECETDYFEEADALASFNQAISQLPERTQRVLELSRIGMTQAEIAKELGYSRSYISRIVTNAKSKLKLMLD